MTTGPKAFLGMLSMSGLHLSAWTQHKKPCTILIWLMKRITNTVKMLLLVVRYKRSKDVNFRNQSLESISIKFNPRSSHTKDLKNGTWYLTLSIIRCISRIKWSNPGEGVVPSPTPQCSSYWKGSLWIALDYSRLLAYKK